MEEPSELAAVFWEIIETLSDEIHLAALLFGLVLGAVFMAAVLPESWA